MTSGRTVVNALIGAVVSIVLSFLMFSPIIGGAVAGFLEGPDGRDGAVVGALSGAIVFLPFAAVVFFVFFVFFGFGFGVGAAPIEGVAVVLFLFGFVGAITLVGTVGLSALGGYLGAYLAREHPETRTSTRQTIGMGADDPRDRSGPRDSRDRRDRPARGDDPRTSRDRAEPSADVERDDADGHTE
ncbi:DUF5518 domain-containing protein [Salinilacihabitans rarus]|uniref:DUF5518 domain-containing protein n=1 Tax=Salinilacihabitans rarus TaxID=2961596 RepID=UPI0020C927D8|nr:DUF5518 domain-containing protein [Salinilacihabitans rarus]